jgi:hypothetical protein
LQEVFNDTRVEVWKQQPAGFFEEAVLDADGTMVETTGQCKERMDINYKSQWSYQPVELSLANTAEPLKDRSANGTSASIGRAARTMRSNSRD